MAVVARGHNGQDLPADWSYSLAWFLDLYGSATEAGRLDGALAECATHMIALGTGEGEAAAPVEDIGYALLALFAKPETYRRSAPGIAEIAQEVLSLTKINWNSTQINQKLPIPILAARRVGELLKYLSEESISSDYRKYT
ncbi:hypothetical protein NKI74_31535 [Mesorhizobium sp. M0494]|uniref:hypothetical protein n=1 Tax=Mesorhizobium sp. M0494 TaxID=2956951 RepID=UPI00333B4D67